ncbi:MAG: hypothetical protein ACTSQJ_12480 [Promethearchaeota archaeon]
MKNTNNNNNEEENGVSIISEIIQENIYSINIEGYDIKDTINKSINNVLWADKWSQDIFYKLFIIFKEELECVTLFMGLQDIFSCTSKLLSQKFYKEFLNKENLEDSIKQKIKNLEEFKFYTSSSIYEKYKTIKNQYEEITIDKIKKMFISLRERRLKIYKYLLKDFKKNKEKYLDFMKKQDYSFV